MKILVTGGAGYIASHTNVQLLEKGYEVVVLDNLSNSCVESIKRVEELTGKTVKFYKGDCRDREMLKKIFTENKIDAVIHFAGLKAVGESCEKPMLYYDNNLNSNLALAETMSAFASFDALTGAPSLKPNQSTFENSSMSVLPFATTPCCPIPERTTL